MTYVIRAAERADLPVLRSVEVAAGRCFADIGMPEIAEDAPPALATLESYREAGRAWVAADAADVPVGYLLIDPIDGAGHVEQVSVHPSHGGRRLGARLISSAGEWARSVGAAALTLTTFRDVPWNAPYYARLGFRVLDPGALSPGLVAVRAAEAAHGLDRWPRVAMRRELGGSRSAAEGGLS